jgi:hypothetical protein
VLTNEFTNKTIIGINNTTTKDRSKFLRDTNIGAGKIRSRMLICTTVNRFNVELAPWKALNNSAEKLELKLEC